MLSPRREFALTCGGIGFTALATALTFFSFIDVSHTLGNDPIQRFALFAFAFIILLLVYGSFVHQCARAGFLARLRRHVPVSHSVLEEVYMQPAAPLAV